MQSYFAAAQRKPREVEIEGRDLKGVHLCDGLLERDDQELSGFEPGRW